MPAGRGPARRQPWPYDLVLSGITGVTGRVGFMLGQPGNRTSFAQGGASEGSGSIVTVVRPDAAPEETAAWRNWHRGYGVRVEESGGGDIGHYYYALGVDASIEGQLMLGPLITTVTPTNDLDTTNGITHFFEIGGSLYALNGRYVKKRTADTAAGWGTTDKDFGVGKAALDVVNFKDNNTGTEYAYVAMGDSEFFQYSTGAAWAQHASLYARAWCVTGRELYRATSTNTVAKVDTNSNPLTAANWGATNQFRVGDQSGGITRMVTNAAGILLVLKTDGVYALDEDGNDIQLYSDLKISPDSTNGRWNFKWENWVHLTLTGRHFRIGPDLSIEPIGPERFIQNDSPVHGYITAGVGTAYAAYAGMYNPDSGNSYLMKFGAWDVSDRPQRIDAWHGSLSQVFSGKKITAMHRSAIGAASGHERLYLGFSDGTVGWFTLPCVPNPYGCSSYTVPTTSANYLYLPAWHAGDMDREKHLRMFTLTSQGLGSGRSVDVGTAAIGDTTTSSFTEVAFTTSPAMRVEVATDTVFTMTDVRVEIVGAGSTVARVLGLAITFARRPPPSMVIECYPLVADFLSKRDGTPFRIGGPRLRSVLRSALETKGSLTAILPDETTPEVTVVGLEEAMAWNQRKKAYQEACKLQLVVANKLTTVGGSSSETLI